MENINPQYKNQLAELAHQLVTPERYGSVAVQQAVKLELATQAA